MGIEMANKRIYLSGVMTGKPDWNREAFAKAARLMRGQGASVFNPAFTAPTDKEQVKPHTYYMLRDLHELTRHHCDCAYYDVLAQLPGWEESNGATIEMLVARACGIEVLTI